MTATKTKHKNNHLKGQLLLVEHLHPKAFPGAPKAVIAHDLYKAKLGVLKAHDLFEYAIAKRSHLKRTPEFYKDFSDNSDAKTAVSFDVTNLNHRKAKISNIQTKIGILRCIVACPVLECIYYFKFPRSAYKDQGTINIRFKVDGTPNFGKWAKYQVKTWHKLTH
jgi:hypothetical protein